MSPLQKPANCIVSSWLLSLKSSPISYSSLFFIAQFTPGTPLISVHCYQNSGKISCSSSFYALLISHRAVLLVYSLQNFVEATAIYKIRCGFTLALVLALLSWSLIRISASSCLFASQQAPSLGLNYWFQILHGYDCCGVSLPRLYFPRLRSRILHFGSRPHIQCRPGLSSFDFFDNQGPSELISSASDLVSLWSVSQNLGSPFYSQASNSFAAPGELRSHSPCSSSINEDGRFVHRLDYLSLRNYLQSSSLPHHHTKASRALGLPDLVETIQADWASCKTTKVVQFVTQESLAWMMFQLLQVPCQVFFSQLHLNQM